MSADIIQFVPKANPERDEHRAKIIIWCDVPNDCVNLPDTAPSEYVAPDGDCA